ncbi:unnamed protein product, partial [Ixodes persulcatus]
QRSCTWTPSGEGHVVVGRRNAGRARTLAPTRSTVAFESRSDASLRHHGRSAEVPVVLFPKQCVLNMVGPLRPPMAATFPLWRPGTALVVRSRVRVVSQERQERLPPSALCRGLL